MTTNLPQNYPEPEPGDATREVLAVVLVVLGVVALVVAAFLTSPVLGLAATGVAMVGAGAALAYREA